MKLENIKGILFDYGATIDTNGKHWAEVLWDAYQQVNVPVSREAFREAYVYGERYLATHKVIEEKDNFYELLLKKTSLQINYLKENFFLSSEAQNYSQPISEICYGFVKESIANAIPVLNYLYEKYPMVLVSNFYGNVETVLEDFGIREYFKSIVESAIVNVRKPDPAIFTLGVNELNLPAENVVVVGDSYTKDILPATSAGCKTIWLKGIGWDEKENTENPVASGIIYTFTDLKKIL